MKNEYKINPNPKGSIIKHKWKKWERIDKYFIISFSGQNIENQQLTKEMNQNYTNIFGVF